MPKLPVYTLSEMLITFSIFPGSGMLVALTGWEIKNIVTGKQGENKEEK